MKATIAFRKEREEYARKYFPTKLAPSVDGKEEESTADTAEKNEN
jgi:hypothetical protein